MFAQELELAFESVEEGGSFDSVINSLDVDWIEQSLFATDKVSIRRRRLAAQQAVWLVILIGLMRNQSIKEVCGSIDLALPSTGTNSWSHVTPSVLTDCRKASWLIYSRRPAKPGWNRHYLDKNAFGRSL
ncbi:transposase domain-containing protein [Photobacterium damselae]